MERHLQTDRNTDIQKKRQTERDRERGNRDRKIHRDKEMGETYKESDKKTDR